MIVHEKQGRFRKGRRCVDQIFTLRRIVEKVLEKNKRKCKQHLWILKRHIMGLKGKDSGKTWLYSGHGRLLNAVTSFYTWNNSYKRVNGERNILKKKKHQRCVVIMIIYVFFYGKGNTLDESEVEQLQCFAEPWWKRMEATSYANGAFLLTEWKGLNYRRL